MAETMYGPPYVGAVFDPTQDNLVVNIVAMSGDPEDLNLLPHLVDCKGQCAIGMYYFPETDSFAWPKLPGDPPTDEPAPEVDEPETPPA